MQRIKTVLDLLTFIDERIKSGEIDFETPVSVSRDNFLRDAKLSVNNASKRQPRKVVSRGGETNLVIE